ncbi:MAG: hypothetical protein SF053_20145 [Bacteroidia bacterium]|nr:hypothetical protein [Bacteroidia bacterium]
MIRKIAFPLYDVVFKYLMEDLEVARRFIGGIIGREIISIAPRPQEHTLVLEQLPITVYRVDFVAVVSTTPGKYEKVTIEVQKSHEAPDILRFRRYLGEHYANAETLGNGIREALPVICIYILGFDLRLPHAIVHARKDFRNLVTGEEVFPTHDFVQLLTHESYFIQVSLLPDVYQHKVERLLSVFSRKWVHDKDHRWIISYDDAVGVGDEDLRLIIRRLELAIADAEVRKRILDIEDAEREIEQRMGRMEQTIGQMDKTIMEKNKIISEKDQALSEKDQALSEKDQALQRSVRALRSAGLSDSEIAATLNMAIEWVAGVV